MRFVVMALVLLVTACAPRGEITLAPQAKGVGTNHTVFVGTSRASDPQGAFSFARSEKESFARFDISIPPDRQLGEIEWPDATIDPQQDFLTTSRQVFATHRDFRNSVTAELRNHPRGQREVVLYIHGFNNTFAEGLYRIAQMSNDLKIPGVPMHYSWPSRGSPFGYVYDRDSVFYARDGLEVMLNEIVAAGAERIILVGHSMGALLTMEALRQLAIADNRKVMDRIGGVVLASPDIDVDVFRMQAIKIGKLPQPFLIFASQRDSLLGLSARVAGEPERLGNLSNLARVADLKVTVLETGQFKDGDAHFAIGTSPALIGLVRSVEGMNAALAHDNETRGNLLTGTVLTVQNATKIILSPVTALARGLAP